MRNTDLYQVLGVKRDATAADLKKAYRDLALRYHPDKCPGDKDAEEIFKEAANAYHVLADTERRERYDRQGLEGLRSGNPPPSPGFTNVDDVISTFGDLFGEFFGKPLGPRSRRGKDLRADLTLTFAEAVCGTRKSIKVERAIPCKHCDATGEMSGSRAEACSTCQGKGQILIAQGFFMARTMCRQCQGIGRLSKNPCGPCRGNGTTPRTAEICVHVPAGVDDGQLLRIAGKGDHSAHGTAGNLYVTLHVKEDPNFRREGKDIVSDVSLDMTMAALGGEISLRTLDSNCTGHVIIDVHPGTQPGHRLIRRGHGLERGNGQGRGDHVVVFRVETPRNLTETQVKLLRQFAAEAPR